MEYRIRFNLLTNKDLNFYISKRPSIPVAEKQFNQIDIKGADGEFYEDLGTYDDLEIDVECNFVSSSADNWNKDYRRIRRWINNINDYTLTFSDNKGYYYKVKSITVDTSERLIKALGTFTLKFIIDPYEYLNEGLEEIILTNILQNDYSVSKPTYRIEGNGDCTLTVNGNSITATVDSNGININTELGLIYYDSGTYCTTKVSIEDFKAIYLQEDANNFSWTSGFNVYIIPNYRVI